MPFFGRFRVARYRTALYPFLATLLLARCGVEEEAHDVGARSDALTSGLSGKFFNVASGGAITQVATYPSLSRTWHTIIQGRSNNQLVFYDRIEGILKTILIATDGSLTLQRKYTGLPTTWDILVRGDFAGSSAKDLLVYDRAADQIKVYEIDAGGNLLLAFTQTIPGNWHIATAGYWGNPSARDDLLLYSKVTGEGRFFRSTGVSFANAASRQWRKVWDQIVAVRLDGDSLSELLFFNQDSGYAKTYHISTAFGLTLLQELSWPITEKLAIIPGEFGGSSNAQSDLLIYDQTAGTGTFLVSGSNGTLSTATVHPSWNTVWTHIVPVQHAGTTLSKLFFYTNVMDVRFVPVRVADNDGTNGAALTSAQMNTWLASINRTYVPAGIRMVWDGTIRTLSNTFVNGYDCEGDAGMAKLFATAYAPTFGANNSLVVYFRKYSGTGCSSPTASYVVMPGFTGTSTIYRRSDGKTTDINGNVIADGAASGNNLKLLGHEIGHYFGLPHGHMGSQPLIAAVMDTDAFVDDNWTSILDTPPSPTGNWWTPPSNICDPGMANDFPVPTTWGGPVDINPDRHTVMNHGFNCDLAYWFSPAQINAVRASLFGNRANLTQ